MGDRMTAASAYETGLYWRRRAGLIYYKAVSFIVNALQNDVDTIVDVGSGNTPVLEEFDWARRRLSIDIRKPYESDGVEALVCDIMTVRDLPRFDLCLCLQVLEHVPDAGAFARRLLELADVVIVSVPYRWAGRTKGHIHDPVDEDKLRDWMGRDPVFSLLVEEPRDHKQNRRLISAYDPQGRSRSLAALGQMRVLHGADGGSG